MTRLLSPRTRFAPIWALLVLLTTLLAATAARADDAFLDPAVAFQLSTRVLPGQRVELTYRIAPGYYLYRERFKFSSPDATLGDPQIPPGKKHFDAALEEEVETYHDQVVVVLPVLAGGKAITIAATHQGCAEKGLCYPPQPRTVNVTMKAFGAGDDSAAVAAVADDSGPGPAVGAVVRLPADRPAGGMSTPTEAAPASLRSGLLGGATPDAGASASAPASATLAAPAKAAAEAAPPSTEGDDTRFTRVLRGGHLWAILSLAFVLGLGLAATPCVWPMLPILSSIIVGQGKAVTPMRGFLLAATYSLGMALVYTGLGVAAGLAGEGFAGYLQNPVVLVVFAALLVLLSLSMFGFYELQLPAALRDRLSAKNDALSGGQVGGVFGMGVLSALIVSPCVSAPLVGVLVYIGEAHDALLGGLGLFTMAAGMSVPLLVIGASAGTVLPRSGAWMDVVKRAFGLLLLGVAIYIVQPVLPPLLAMIAWGVLAIVAGASLGAFEPISANTAYVGTARTVKGLGLVLAVAGVFELVGAASGGRDPAQPLSHFARAGAAAPMDAGGVAAAPVADGASPRFDRVASVAELDRRLQAAGRPVLLDFYADWCVSCKEMEARTFVDPAVRAKLDNAVLLRADVTANSEDDRALLKRFHLFGPPGIILFDAQGRELESARVVGFRDAKAFSGNLSAVGL